MTEATQRTSDNGVSIWLDDLSRSRIESGSLQDLIANKNVVGVTTNPLRSCGPRSTVRTP